MRSSEGYRLQNGLLTRSRRIAFTNWNAPWMSESMGVCGKPREQDAHRFLSAPGLFFGDLTNHKWCRFAKGGTLENHHIEELRAELDGLLKKQVEVLELRTFGGATDTDILEYEIRQEAIHEICNQLANSTAA